MPKRTRSHELEDLSIARFNDLLPGRWVSRYKSADYGIDLEVELFDEDGEATGLVFLVQIRATDSIKRRNRLVLEADELNYYAQLDLPVLIARYCSVTNDFHWQWDSTIGSRVSFEPGQATVTYKFSEAELWNVATVTTIRRTLEVRRTLARFPQTAAVPVRLDLTKMPIERHYGLEREFGEMIAQAAGALVRAKERRSLEIDIVVEPSFLRVGIDAIKSVTFDLPESTNDQFLRSAVYALIKLMVDNGLRRQAKTLSEIVRARGMSHHSESLALSACRAFDDDPEAMVDVAILNGLHRHSPFHGAIVIELSRLRASKTSEKAQLRFFAAALDAAEDDGTRGVVHYSIANYLRGMRYNARSLLHFNRARRLRPSYLQSEYFLREMGGVLYEGGHPRCALKSYRMALAITNDPFDSFLLGDALFRSGKIAEARKHYEKAEGHLSSHIVQELELKRLVCEWLVKEIGCEDVPVRRQEANSLMSPDGNDAEENLRSIIINADSLNPLAHFNLGVCLGKARKNDQALPHFLVCAIGQPGDVEAWANASLCAFSVNQSNLLVVILSVAIQYAGHHAYDRLRSDLEAQHAAQEVLIMLDNVAAKLLSESQATDPAKFTVRILNEDGHDELAIIDP